MGVSRPKVGTMISKKNISLTQFIVSQVSLFLLIMTLLLSYISYIAIKNQIETLIGQKIDYILTSQSINAESYLWNYDTEGLTSIADSVLADPQILAVRIIEIGEKSLPHTTLENGSVPFPKDDKDPSILSREMIHVMPDKTEKKIGLFQVFVDYKSVRTEIAYKVFIMAMMAAIAYVVLLTVIYFTLKKSLYPITYMSKQLEESDAEKINLERLPETQTKEIETLFDAFETLQKKIYDHQQSLISSIEQAEKANKIKDTFMANMSHELRTPLNSIIGMMKILQEGTNLQKEQKEMMEIIDKSSHSLLTIVNDILDISKIESEKIVLEHHPFNIEQLITNITKQFNPDKNVEVTIDTKNIKDINVFGDHHHLKKILMNLYSNTIKYTKNGHITVHAYTKEISKNKVEFICSFEDTGIGIQSDKIDTIFEKFTQAEDSITRRFGGTGLGLSITKQLVELMGGTIHVESSFGEGSKFTVCIPFELTTDTAEAQEDSDSNNIITETKPENSNTNPSDNIEKRIFASAKVLIAEDHEFNQILVKKLVKRIGCENSDLVIDGKEAVKAFENNSKDKQQQYDLILMDCHMPEMNGYEATQAIREIENNQQERPTNPTIIIALTADAMVGAREKCLQSGMDDYISKPIDEDVLKNALDKWFEFK